MRAFFRQTALIKALIFFDIAAIAFIWDWFAFGFMTIRTLSEHLIDLGVSLEGLQAGVQRYVNADLWDSVLVPLLLTPTVLLFLVFAVVAWFFAELLRAR